LQTYVVVFAGSVTVVVLLNMTTGPGLSPSKTLVATAAQPEQSTRDVTVSVFVRIVRTGPNVGVMPTSCVIVQSLSAVAAVAVALVAEAASSRRGMAFPTWTEVATWLLSAPANSGEQTVLVTVAGVDGVVVPVIIS
jgi:hypothetical protein